MGLCPLLLQALLWSMSMRKSSPQTVAWGGTCQRCWWYSLMDVPRTTWRRVRRNCSTLVGMAEFICFVCICIRAGFHNPLYLVSSQTDPLHLIKPFIHSCRLQHLCGGSGRRRHDRVENHRQQTQRETRVCCRRLWCFRQDPRQLDHFHLWNSHFQ